MSGWAIGYLVGAAVVVVVVAVVIVLTVQARRAARQAEAITETLDRLRENTTGLWELEVTNVTADRLGDAVERGGEPAATGTPGRRRRT